MSEQLDNQISESNQEIQSNEQPKLDSQEQKVIEKQQNGEQLSKAEQKMIKSLKIKFDGKEIEEELPFAIPEDPNAIEYMRKQIQKSKLADRSTREHAELRKQVDQFVDILKHDPASILSNPAIGIDVKEFAKKIIEQEIERASKSPEQLKQEEIQKELEKYKKEAEEREKALQEERMKYLEEKYYQEYDQKLTKVLESNELPKSPYIIKKMAEYMHSGLTKGMDLQPEDILPLVKKEIHEDLKQMFDLLPEDVVEQIVGSNNLDRIRKKRINSSKQQENKPIDNKIKDTGAREIAKYSKNEPQKKVTFSEFFKK